MKKSCLIGVRSCLSNVALVLFLSTAAGTLAGVHYVDVNSTNATPPCTNWTTAASEIQDAVDAAVAGDEIVVTNGIYATGGRATVDRLDEPSGPGQTAERSER